jgi:hypothetical protein
MSEEGECKKNIRMEEKVEKNEKLWKFLTIYSAFFFRTKDLNQKKLTNKKYFFFC